MNVTEIYKRKKEGAFLGSLQKVRTSGESEKFAAENNRLMFL
jgi:hypothetical protein